jgi:hypothetical protein
LNLDFSEKSGRAVGATAGVGSAGVTILVSIVASGAGEVSASGSSDVTLLFFLTHPVDDSPDRVEEQLQHVPSSSAQAQQRDVDSCCS